MPNLWQLLQKHDARVDSFYVGNRNFDPKKVGFETTEVPGSTTLFRVNKAGTTTTISGNSNAGHEYGTDLSDSEKWALIEFMKTL